MSVARQHSVQVIVHPSERSIMSIVHFEEGAWGHRSAVVLAALSGSCASLMRVHCRSGLV
ncbi:hypothetical protein AOA80_04885 [Methanomassiliicoccales archaeon RumEn M1]|nr:hypothetical protein AOA80_04885 [Methanomassiliicoccales archaeon RumEn M1]